MIFFIYCYMLHLKKIMFACSFFILIYDHVWPISNVCFLEILINHQYFWQIKNIHAKQISFFIILFCHVTLHRIHSHHERRKYATAQWPSSLHWHARAGARVATTSAPRRNQEHDHCPTATTTLHQRQAQANH